ncbi:polysaccharide deacetylase family protein [Candidatus Giovannonibacteria bacterium]|nr:polysaccharide deacetylase family protein [Candidatus Giovannonibacteria bacterium]
MKLYKIAIIVFVLAGIIPGAAVLAAEKRASFEGWKTPNVEKNIFIPNGKFKGLRDRKTNPVRLINGGVSSQELIRAQALGPNLIQNPSVETSDSTGFPVGWKRGGYGSNSRTLSYPVAGFNSPRGLQVSISSYTSGDAKWFFNDVPVTPGHTYQFSDSYISNVTSFIDIRYTMQNGSFVYSGLAAVGPSSTYTNISFVFTVPQGAVSVTIFHDIASVGTLTTDAFSLNDMNAPPPASNNLVSNGDFETAGTNGLPAGWGRGRFGTNTANFTYPIAGVNGSKAARVSISSHTSGDAKWFFNPISASPGVYTYSDQYLANIPSTITVQYHLTNGSFVFNDISSLPAAGGFTFSSVDFTVPANVADITVFHLIEGVGSLTIDNASLVKKSDLTGIFATGAVSLTFDHAYVSQYQNAVPKLNNSGFKGTFFVITREVADTGFPAIISRAQIKELFNMGHEIGSHTRTHADLPTLTAAEQKEEIEGARQDLLALNIGPIPSFAYPFGDYDSTTLQIVKNSGYSNARTTIVRNANPTSDPFQLPAFSVQVTTPISQVKSMIDNAIANKQWLILTFHQIDNGGEKYSITPANFNQIIDYLAAKNVPVVTVAEGIKDLQ